MHKPLPGTFYRKVEKREIDESESFSWEDGKGDDTECFQKRTWSGIKRTYTASC